MEVDTSEVLVASQSSSADTAACPKSHGVSASQARDQPTGPHQRSGPKAKQRANDQQGIRAMVANIMEPGGLGAIAKAGLSSPSWRAPCHAGRCTGS